MLKLGLIATVLVTLSVADADARGSSARYSMYGYSGSGSDYDMYGFGSRGSSYDVFRNVGRSSGSTGRYWGGSTSIQRYNDPTGQRMIEVQAPRPPLPSGNYDRARNRARTAY